MSKTAVKNNPSRPSEAAPVKVSHHFRAEPGSTENLRARRRGQTDLFADMQWTRNPVNFTITRKDDSIFALIKDADVKKLACGFGTATRDGRVKFTEKSYFKFLDRLNKQFEMKTNPEKPILELRIGHYGSNLIQTNLDLKGQGITLFSDGKDHARGLKTYKVTDRALARLEKQFDVVYKNPATASSDHPVEVNTYYRQPPASFHQKVRRQGQQDLWAGMDWKRNPAANFLQSLLVRHSYGKTIVTTPTGERITLPGTLTRADALKQASRQFIKNNPAFESDEHAAAAAEFLEEMIDALDVDNDGELDAEDVDEMRAFHSLEGEPESEIKIEIDGEDYLNELFGENEPDVSAMEVSDADGERDGVIIDSTSDGHLVVAWIDDEGKEQIGIEHPENVLHVGEPDEQIKENPAKYVLKGTKIANGKRVFIQFSDRAKAAAKKLKLEKTGNFEKLRIHTTGNNWNEPEVKNNPDALTNFANLAWGLANTLSIGKEVKKAHERQKRAARAVSAKKNGKPTSKSSAKKAKTRKNPSGVTFEMFSGRPSTKTVEKKSSHFTPRKLESMGELIEIKLVGRSAPVSFVRKNNRFPYELCSDQDGRLHIVGATITTPDPTLQKNEISSYGEIDTITYRQQKEHLGDKEPKFYKHKFGEEGGTRPELCADHLGYALIEGGSYRIKPDYDGVHSSGIRD